MVAAAELIVAATIASVARAWMAIFMLFPFELVVSETAYTVKYVPELKM